MGHSAIIYTKEEARGMEPLKRPICYRVSSKIYHAAFEAAGHASGCWKPKPEGVFDSDEASKAALDLLFVVAAELERLGVTFEQLNDGPQFSQNLPLPLELAQRTARCRLCGQKFGTDAMPEGWAFDFNEMVFPVRIILKFGKECAHAECLNTPMPCPPPISSSSPAQSTSPGSVIPCNPSCDSPADSGR